tara:strand:- start:88 stop:276 length:189 start_codon:yes stop_codon:yes gene_type:complete
MKNGIYKSNDATYFVLDGKVLMRIMGSMYKTTKHFMFGDYIQELQPGMIEQFDEVYNEVKQW